MRNTSNLMVAKTIATPAQLFAVVRIWDVLARGAEIEIDLEYQTAKLYWGRVGSDRNLQWEPVDQATVAALLVCREMLQVNEDDRWVLTRYYDYCGLSSFGRLVQRLRTGCARDPSTPARARTVFASVDLDADDWNLLLWVAEGGIFDLDRTRPNHRRTRDKTAAVTSHDLVQETVRAVDTDGNRMRVLGLTPRGQEYVLGYSLTWLGERVDSHAISPALVDSALTKEVA